MLCVDPVNVSQRERYRGQNLLNTRSYNFLYENYSLTIPSLSGLTCGVLPNGMRPSGASPLSTSTSRSNSGELSTTTRLPYEMMPKRSPYTRAMSIMCWYIGRTPSGPSAIPSGCGSPAGAIVKQLHVRVVVLLQATNCYSYGYITANELLVATLRLAL